MDIINISLDFDKILDIALENTKKNKPLLDKLHTLNIDDIAYISSLIISEDFKRELYKELSKQLNSNID